MVVLRWEVILYDPQMFPYWTWEGVTALISTSGSGGQMPSKPDEEVQQISTINEQPSNSRVHLEVRRKLLVHKAVVFLVRQLPYGSWFRTQPLSAHSLPLSLWNYLCTVDRERGNGKTTYHFFLLAHITSTHIISPGLIRQPHWYWKWVNRSTEGCILLKCYAIERGSWGGE